MSFYNPTIDMRSDDPVIQIILYAVSIIVSVFAGVLLGIVGIPIPLFTREKRGLRKKTHWKFENLWLFYSITGLLICPVIGVFAFVWPPLWTTEYIFVNFDISEWIVPVSVIALYPLLGFTAWSYSMETIGVSISTSISFGISIIVYTIITYSANNSIFSQHIVVGIIGILGMLATLIGVIIIGISSMILEKNTTRKRMEVEDLYIKQINKKNAAKNNNKEKTTSKGKLRFHWYVGFACAVISGLGQPMLGIGLTSGDELAAKIIKASPTMTLFKVRMVLATFGLFLGCILVFLTILLLLVSRGSIRKIVVFEGGICGILDGCYNFKYVRLIGIFVSLIMGFIYYLSFILYVYAESVSYTRTSFQYIIWSGVATVIYFIIGQIFREMANTKLFVKLLIIGGFALEMIGFIVVGFGTANYTNFNFSSFTNSSTINGTTSILLANTFNKGF
eukprot:gene5523-9340_t